VIATLRTGRLTAIDRELRSLRDALAANPTYLPLALEVARRGIERSRLEADPRFLSQAQVALKPWWTQTSPPVEVLILRATIRQSRHDFSTALADLDLALARDPHQVQAWLTKATLHTVRAEFVAARQAIAHLLGLTDELTLTTAAAQIAALTGHASQACVQLETVLARSAPSDSALVSSGPVSDQARLVWAKSLLAETYARLGRPADAERVFRSALSQGPRDPYLLGAFADFLLDQRRPIEVITLLQNYRRLDGLLLRLAEAEAQATGNPQPDSLSTLTARFDAARIRGDRVHLREEARFELRLRKNPAAALVHARDNWQVQREPIDARLLLEAAHAVGEAAVTREVQQWIKQTGLEDVALHPITLARDP